MNNATLFLRSRLQRWSVAAAFSLLALSAGARADDPELEKWIQYEKTFATNRLLDSISNKGKDSQGRAAAPGSVIASPSTNNPNYFFHWVRDAAIVTDVVTSLYDQAADKNDKASYFGKLKDYSAFSRKIQLAPAAGQATTGLGEPRFYVDGTVNGDAWGRPQNDGPALRASNLIRFANLLLDGGGAAEKEFAATLYQNTLPANSLIKADLEYVAHNWQNPCVDLWEEMNAKHFYTRLVQYRAMRTGAKFARRMNDPGAATFYDAQAKLLMVEIEKHWDAKSGYIFVMLDPGDNQKRKANELDLAIVLAAIHTDEPGDPFFGPTDDRTITTADRLSRVFRELYTINQVRANKQERALQPGIGRYIEDTYDGPSTNSRGNPWFLGSAAYAELCYRGAADWSSAGSLPITKRNIGFLRGAMASQGSKIEITEGVILKKDDPRFGQITGALIELGDGYLRRIKEHADKSGSLSEQFDRNDGTPQSARDLSWSYAAVLTAFQQREIALKKTKELKRVLVPGGDK